MTTRPIWLGAVAGLVLALGGCKRGDIDDTDYASHPLATGAKIDRISWYQGVERRLLRNDGEPGRGIAPPPPIANRDAMLRVFVSPEDRDSFLARMLAVVVELRQGEEAVVATERQVIWGSWREANLGSTAVFPIPADLVTPDLEITVSVREVNPWPASLEAPDVDDLLWTSGDLEVVQTGVIELHLLPYAYTADGSGRVPDMSEAGLAAIRDRVLGAYPVERVELVVEETRDWGNPISSSSGLSALLSDVAARRAEAEPSPGAYFYGLVDPARDFGTFCGGGCTTGLSSVPETADAAWLRTSVGVGFPEAGPDTLIHEVGHAHGRSHAPCGGPAGVDPAYPYASGTIGTWGYDVVTQKLLDPTTFVDMMSYCSPTWVSDYTFAALRQRVSSVAGLRSAATEAPWQLALVSGDGALEMVQQVWAPVVPGGEPVEVVWEGPDGAEAGVGEGWFGRFDHEPGGLLLVEPPRRGQLTGRLR